MLEYKRGSLERVLTQEDIWFRLVCSSSQNIISKVLTMSPRHHSTSYIKPNADDVMLYVHQMLTMSLRHYSTSYIKPNADDVMLYVHQIATMSLRHLSTSYTKC